MGNVYRGVPVGPLGKKDLKPIWKEQQKYLENSDGKASGHVADAVRRLLRANKDKEMKEDRDRVRASAVTTKSAKTEASWKTEKVEDFENDVQLALEQLRTYSERLVKFDVKP